MGKHEFYQNQFLSCHMAIVNTFILYYFSELRKTPIAEATCHWIQMFLYVKSADSFSRMLQVFFWLFKDRGRSSGEEVAHEVIVYYYEPTQPNPGYDEADAVRLVRPFIWNLDYSRAEIAAAARQ